MASPITAIAGANNTGTVTLQDLDVRTVPPPAAVTITFTGAGTYTRSAQTVNASGTHTVTGLAAGTWYFVVTALNAQGQESAYSNVWSKTVP